MKLDLSDLSEPTTDILEDLVKEFEQIEKEHDEFEVKKELQGKRKNINSLEDLMHYISDIEENYTLGYGAVPRAIAQAMLATGLYLANKNGLSGFQANCVLMDIFTGWNHMSNKCGLKVIDYDRMLYPNCEDEFDKTIPQPIFEALQKEAQNWLNDPCLIEIASPAGIKHLQSIVNGTPPFGYKVG